MPLNPPDIKELRAIVDWVNLTEDVREVSLKFGDVELFISRDRQQPGDHALPVPAPAPAPVPVPVPVPQTPASTAPAAPAAPASAAATATAPAPVTSGPVSTAELASDEVLIKAPMVGTYYSSPKPGASAFVAVGDRVGVDTVLCIVEVMKLMSNIEARVVGTITKILVENEQAVEYGQPLMVIKRDG